MQIIALILSGLALLAAIVCLILILQVKKRSKERNAALKKYIDKKVAAGYEAAGNGFLECVKEIEGRHKRLQKRVEDLEHGIVPDFEEAKKAADAVNDFNRGLSGILGFDPIEAARKSRRAGNGGDFG